MSTESLVHEYLVKEEVTMADVTISVIIAVYNGEQYIKKCTDMLLHQDFKNFEVIFVDDGSIDKTNKLLTRVAHLYENIRLFSQKNKGVSVARNEGIKNIRGEFIVFMDIDDEISPGYLSGLYEAISKPNSDLGICGYSEKNKIGYFTYDGDGISRYYSSDDLIRNYLQNHKICSALWNKIFRSSLVLKHEICFNESISIGEDMLFLTDYVMHIRKAYFISRCLYVYLLNSNGAMQKDSDALTFNLKWLSEWRAIVKVADIIRDSMGVVPQEVDVKKVRITTKLIDKMQKGNYFNSNLFKELLATHRKYILPFLCARDVNTKTKLKAGIVFISPKLLKIL